MKKIKKITFKQYMVVIRCYVEKKIRRGEGGKKRSIGEHFLKLVYFAIGDFSPSYGKVIFFAQ